MGTRTYTSPIMVFTKRTELLAKHYFENEGDEAFARGSYGVAGEWYQKAWNARNCNTTHYRSGGCRMLGAKWSLADANGVGSKWNGRRYIDANYVRTHPADENFTH